MITEAISPSEELYVFGTGNAAVTHCYNTCFAIRTETYVPGSGSREEFFMVDTGGGNGILGILERMNVSLFHIHHIFITHEHTDHLLGIVWMVCSWVIKREVMRERCPSTAMTALWKP